MCMHLQQQDVTKWWEIIGKVCTAKLTVATYIATQYIASYSFIEEG